MTTTHLNVLSLDALKSLCNQAGPTVSVYLRRSDEPGDQGTETRLRWRQLHATMTDQGATAADASAVEAAVNDAISDERFGDRVLAIFATGGKVAASFELEHFEEPDGASVGRWPHLEPLLRWRDQQVPYLVVVVDHAGGTLAGYDAGGSPIRALTVAGPDDEIERNSPGGWAQGRYQHRAEDSWSHNAAAVGKRLINMSDEIAAQMVIVAGDVRAVQMLIDFLPDRVKHQVVLAPAGAVQHTDGHLQVDPEARAAMMRLTATGIRREHVQLYDEAVGSQRAVEGAADVGAALDRGAVRELLIVHGQAARELADTFIAAALAEDSDVLVVEPSEATLVGGVGASLRF